ncbi:alpha/beta fold hydrolase [Shimazuella sp. AN120528]|nr:alpha/beta fold hydrolase [Shimazuella soli]
MFQAWSDWLGSSVEIIAVELPGHGTRYREKLIPTAEEIATQVIPHILPFFDEPVFFLGHSMGAILAFETVRQLIALNAKAHHLYVIGAYPPYVKKEIFTHQSDDSFVQQIYQLGGIPEGFFQDPDLKAYLLPILRNDFQLTERYNRKVELPCPLTVYAGDHDIPSIKDLMRWKEVQPKSFTLKIFQGNHFFLHQEHEDFHITLKKSLLQQLKEERKKYA